MKLNIVPARTGTQWVRASVRTFFKQPLSKEKGVMSSDWEEGLVAVAKAHPGTKTAKLLEDYLRDLAKAKFVEDKAILDRYKKLLENSFK